MVRTMTLVALAPAAVLFVSSTLVLTWIDVSIAGGLGHMRLPPELLWAHALGACLVVLLMVAVRNRASVGVDEFLLLALGGAVGAWSAFRNHPLCWEAAENVECLAVGLCR